MSFISQQKVQNKKVGSSKRASPWEDSLLFVSTDCVKKSAAAAVCVVGGNV